MKNLVRPIRSMSVKYMHYQRPSLFLVWSC